MTYQIRPKPCASCPYRKDAPSGLWHSSEYKLLAEYDAPTMFQPHAVFICHSDDREKTLCRGWQEVHGDQLLALRLALSFGKITIRRAYPKPCGVPLYASGTEAMRAGLKAIKRPGRLAVKMMGKIAKRLEKP